MTPSAPDIRDTLGTLGWGDGSNVCFYDADMHDITAPVHKALGLIEDPNSPETWNQLVKRMHVEWGGLRKLLCCWARWWWEKKATPDQP